jgi:alpha-galactosidase
MAMQTQTQGLASWVPLSAAVGNAPTRYAMRSAAGPAIVTHFSSRALDGDSVLPIKEVQRVMSEALSIRDYFYGDFYPLLAFSLSTDTWAAWQYDRPEQGNGLVLVFRRHEAPFSELVAKLRALDSQTTYELQSWDDGSALRMTGDVLMSEGFAVAIESKPGSALYTYRRI